MLCKTYKRDPMFASSLLNLLQKLEDEIVKDRVKYEKSEEKKAKVPRGRAHKRELYVRRHVNASKGTCCDSLCVISSLNFQAC